MATLEETSSCKATTEPDEEMTFPTIAETAYDTPPNGGFQAWLQVAGSFLMFFNSWGTVNAFGAFQAYYKIGLLKDQSSSDISWIGAIQTFLLLLVGVVTGPLYDSGYFRTLVITGSFLVMGGFMALSVCTQYWQVLLAQAICVGLGNGCLYIPSVAIIPQYFSSRKAIAIAIGASGSSFGGVIYPIVFRELQPRIGFPWATRVLGFLVLATTLVPITLMRVRQAPKQKRVLTEVSAFKEPPYALFCAAMFFGYIGFFNPIFYIESYALHKNTTEAELAFYLVAILNAASIPGRIIPGLLNKYLESLNILLGSAFISATLSFCWIAIHNQGGLISLAVLYGFFSGAFVSLPAVALTTLTPDLRTLGTRIGMCTVCSGLGSLCGSPVAGAILDRSGSYFGVQLYSGLTTGITGVLLLFASFFKKSDSR